jgi:cobalt-zinc-cadmium efflux system outer membrane protein
LLGTLVDAVGALKAAATQLAAFQGEVLPAAQRAFDRTQVGYNEGRFDILSLLDAQRSVFEARLDIVNSQAEYEKARVQVEALIGRSLDGL